MSARNSKTEKPKFRAQVGIRLWLEVELDDPTIKTIEEALAVAKELEVDNVLNGSYDVCDSSITLLMVGTGEQFDV